ncbi:MAG: flagellar protein FlaG [Acetivibrio ethanolgignens]
MGMEIVGTNQVKAAEAPAKPANQGGTAPANAAPVSVPVQPVMKLSTGNGTGENQEPSGKEGQATEKQIQAAIEHVKRATRMNRTRCEFSYHEATKRVSIKVLDDETNEVIKEIPPEKSLEMVEKMWELAGILVDERR